MPATKKKEIFLKMTLNKDCVFDISVKRSPRVLVKLAIKHLVN